MNRLVLITDIIKNVGRDLLLPEIYPSRELKPNHTNYWIGFFVNLLFKGYFAAEYIDTKNIPETGAAIIAANHSSHLDGMLINTASLYARRRSVAFLAAADVYNSNPLFRTMCNIVKCIPVKRYESDRAALLKTIRLLNHGKLVGIFPEGMRSRDGNIGEGKEGVAVIALATGFPVIPVGINGTFRALPRKTRIIKPAKVKLKFGAPLRFDKGRNPSHERVSWVRDEIMNEIKRLYRGLTSSEEKRQKIAA
ncbi:MAG TPA: lysophospholipid acyltransferase family protein [Thermodesulfobacteriota bacterium]|nr:lysophospholipid acyltransferase family protein [Thermodesulfobacteriota bacterium]